MAADFFWVVAEDGLVKCVIADQGTADEAQYVRMDLAVFVFGHDEQQHCRDAFEVVILKGRTVGNTGIEAGLVDSLGAAVEQGKALVRKNLAVQPFAADDGVE